MFNSTPNILRWPNIKILIGLNQKSLLHCNQSQVLILKGNETVSVQDPFVFFQGTVQVGPHVLSVGLGETVANDLLRFINSPPEAVTVSCHLFPVSFTRRLPRKRPGPQDMEFDNRRKSNLKFRRIIL